MIQKRIAIILSVLTFLFILSSCRYHMGPVEREFFSMDTVNNFTIYEVDESISFSSKREKEDFVESVLIDTGKELTRLSNELPEGKMKTSDASNELKSLISDTLMISENTDGAFDPHLSLLEALWGFTDGDYKVPTDTEIEEVLRTIQEEKESDDTLFDLGGIYKGYASGVLKEYMKSKGVTSASIVLGGNVTLLGSKPDGKPFTVGIKDPEALEKNFGTLEASDLSVVTSGSYERFFRENGKTYGHILDPKTGYPVENELLSVTVVCQDETLSDALSTALFVMGKERAIDFYRSNIYDFEMILFLKDRMVLLSEGIENAFHTNESIEIIEK